MDWKKVAAAIFLGLLVGVSASHMMPEKESECQRTEEAIVEEGNVSGAVACFPPGVLDVNQSEQIDEGSDLECVCRRSYMGNVQIWAINRANR